MLIRWEMAACQPASRKALLESSNLPIAPFKFLRAKRVEELEDLYFQLFLICFFYDYVYLLLVLLFGFLSIISFLPLQFTTIVCIFISFVTCFSIWLYKFRNMCVTIFGSHGRRVEMVFGNSKLECIMDVGWLLLLYCVQLLIIIKECTICMVKKLKHLIWGIHCNDRLGWFVPCCGRKG